MQQLFEIGRPAIGLLKEAAIAGSLEQAIRAVRVLKELHKSDHLGVRTDALAALTLLRGSPRRSVARRAAEALEVNDLWRRQNDPAVVAAAYWSEVRAEASHQIQQAQLEVRDTMDEMRRMTAAGLPPERDTELVESLRETTRRMGRARMQKVRGDIYGRAITHGQSPERSQESDQGGTPRTK